jgi:hypothetical protein
VCGCNKVCYLENREYGRKGPVTLTTWYLLSAKVGTKVRREAAVARSVEFARGLRSRRFFIYTYKILKGSDDGVCG